MMEDESKLVDRAVKGEAEAFGILYDGHHARIYRFVYLKVQSREEAEDLTHQVFLHAWQHIKTYTRQGTPISSWLYRIARNKVIDHYRTSKPSVDLEDAPELQAPGKNYQDALDAKLSSEKISKAIATLKPEYQDVIIMRFVEELSNEETAITMRRSAGAVRLLQHRAVKALKAALKIHEE